MPYTRPPRAPLTLAFTLCVLVACGGEGSPAAPDPWREVDRLAAEAAASSGVSGMAVSVYDASDRRVFSKVYGDFATDRAVAVASASKLVAAAVLLDVVREGALSLDSTTGDVLGWTGEGGTVTLRHLLSFTSGLAPDAPCFSNATTTLAACVEQIRQAPRLAAPGVRFDYGGTHLHVAARMAEVATGQTWNALFRARLGDPLGLPAAAVFYSQPRLMGGTTNPLVAGGLRASMDDYARLLAVAFHDGRLGAVEVATPALFAAQAREPFPGVLVGESPIADLGLPYRYGLGAWLECETPAAGCAVVSSPGAFGFTPWLDREAGYYAIVGMETGGLGSGVVAFSVGLAQSLKPAIRAALGR